MNIPGRCSGVCLTDAYLGAIHVTAVGRGYRLSQYSIGSNATAVIDPSIRISSLVSSTGWQEELRPE
jgi:hypothetical protein